ncbi:DNA-binding protein [Bacillus manliponensis]|uniref:DNA-binding protein n=1 Tax=Bacillus manliponensis TaxID=574376 RepID=A0A073K4X2_9BACI|nr:helix-turn-helix domain-containing protein [Bacillus manliponensis]KEK17323.1 DNA-binding protein [Bacillus manliponensis]
MKYHLNSRAEVEDFINNEILNTPEAAAILDVSKSRMSKMIKDGKLVPIRKMGNISLFLRSDIEVKKQELEESRKKYRPYDE